MGAACSDSSTNRTTGDVPRSRQNTAQTPRHLRFRDDESVRSTSPPPALDSGEGGRSFFAVLFGHHPEQEPESPLDWDIWKKLAIYAGNIPAKLKEKVWMSLFKTEEDRNLSERKVIIKLLKTYLMLFLTKEYKKRKETPPEGIVEYLPIAA